MLDLNDRLEPIAEVAAATTPPPLDVLNSQVRDRLRRRRLLVGAGVAILVVGLLAVAASRIGGNQGLRVASGSGPSTTAAAGRVAANDGMVLSYVTRAGQDIVSVTLLDGSHLQIGYPHGLGLAQAGVRPAGAILWAPGAGPGVPDDPLAGRDLDVRYASPAEIFGGRQPTKHFVGADGDPVPYYPPAGYTPAALVFQFGLWTVMVPDYGAASGPNRLLSDAQLAVYARSLQGHVGADGMPVLNVKAPLRLGHTDTPDLQFGNDRVGLIQRACPATTEPSTNPQLRLIPSTAKTGTWVCSRALGLTITIFGDPTFQARLVQGLNLQP